MRPSPPPPSAVGDNIDRIAGGVRILGNTVVHRRGPDGQAACRFSGRPVDQLVMTTAPVDCLERDCQGDG
jgi:hypothetical protein